MTHQGFVEIERELRKGERLIWSGQPRQGMYFRSDDWLLVPFSVMWGGFAIVWTLGVLTSGARWYMAAWGLPFVVIGTYLMVGRFIHDDWIRRHIRYGVTIERIIIVGGRSRRKIRSFEISRLPEVQFESFPDDTGTIELQRPARGHGKYGGSSGWHSDAISKLERIRDARFVFDTIVNLQRTSAASPAIMSQAAH